MDRRPEGSRRIFAAAALVLMALLVAGVWWFTSRPRVASAPIVPVAAPATEPQPEPEVASPPQRVELGSAAAVPPTVASAPSLGAPAAAVAASKPDLSSKLWTTVHVEDESHKPIANARVVIDTLRREGNTGSSWRSRESNPEATTNDLGDARIWYWEWTSIDGRTQEVDLWVKHPDYASSRMRGVRVGAEPIVVVLESGNVVIVGATTADGRPVKDFAIHTDQDRHVPAWPWTDRPDGRKQTTQLTAGAHTLWVEHDSAELGGLSSEVVSFDVVKGVPQELLLRLQPRLRVVGFLDEIVPRPIANGKVRLIIRIGGERERTNSKVMDAPVREDGTFEVENVPAGLCEVFVLCSGWASKRTTEFNQQRIDDYVVHEKDPKRRARELEHCLQLQRLPVPSAEPLKVVMERTGRVALTIHDKAGVPIAGAGAMLSPNISWLPNTSTLVPWREWQVQTDAQGLAVFEDVPSDGHLWIGAKAETFVMEKASREQTPAIEVRSGETTDATLIMEPK